MNVSPAGRSFKDEHGLQLHEDRSGPLGLSLERQAQRGWHARRVLLIDQMANVMVTDRHLDEALHDLVVQGGELPKSLLGYRSRIGFGGAASDSSERT